MYIHLWHVSCRTRWARLCARLHKASKTATLKWLDPMTSEGINWINPTFLESVEQIFADELVTNHQLGLCAARINFGLLQSVETWHGNTKNHWDTIEARLLRFLHLYIYMSNKLKLTISHKNKGHQRTHTHTYTEEVWSSLQTSRHKRNWIIFLIFSGTWSRCDFGWAWPRRTWLYLKEINWQLPSQQRSAGWLAMASG